MERCFGVTLAFILLVCAAFPVTAETSPRNRVSWEPNEVATAVSIGETVTEPATLRIDLTRKRNFWSKILARVVNERDATVWVTPGLRPFINATPQPITSNGEVRLQDIQIDISAPASTLPSTVNGAIFVRFGKLIILRPLKLRLEFFWAGQFSGGASDDVSFVYPTFGRDARVLAETESSDATRYRVQIQNDNGVYVDEIFLSILDHTGTPDSWLIDNIDPNGVLLSSGALTRRIFDSGIEALMLTGIVPPEYGELNGPISTVFASNPDRSRLVIANVSQDSNFVLPNGDEDTAVILEAVLNSLEF